MPDSNVLELFGLPTSAPGTDWTKVLREQSCPFVSKPCFKTRKSDPSIAIGTCTVNYGQRTPRQVVICPNRMLERKQVFIDCLHLLTSHEPGNELHVVSELTVPGGSVDYVLASKRGARVVDFVGIEFQTLDTTGTVWPERQRLLHRLGAATNLADRQSKKPFGMNWKMTAKTILMQLHHKLETFDAVNRRLVLVMQDHLLDYMRREFTFSHLTAPAIIGESMHFHAYRLERRGVGLGLRLNERVSTDVDGLSAALELQADANISLDQLTASIQAKISAETLLQL
jgi:hypothetical protein